MLTTLKKKRLFFKAYLQFVGLTVHNHSYAEMILCFKSLEVFVPAFLIFEL